MYHEWMEAGRLPLRGLCWSIGDFEPDPNGDFGDVIFTNEFLVLFEPPPGEYGGSYWGYGDVGGGEERMYSFTTFRQTVVLLMAAMNDEL